MRVLAISGSLRAASFNTALLRAAAELAPAGVELELYDGLDTLPPFNEDREGDPGPAVEDLRERLHAADAVLLSTPEYNGTMPGQLKQVVDWGSRPFGGESALWGKPAAVLGASVTDYGAVWAQDQLRKSLGLAGARVVEGELPVTRAPERFSGDGRLVDPEIRRQLAELLGRLVEATRELTAAAHAG